MARLFFQFYVQAAQLLEHDPAVMRELLAEVAKQVNKIMAQVRSLAHKLHPPELELREFSLTASRLGNGDQRR